MGCGAGKYQHKPTAASCDAATPLGDQLAVDAAAKKRRSLSQKVRSKLVSEKDLIILEGKYTMYMSKAALLGEGASGICRRGKDIATDKDVAIKVYKPGSHDTIDKFLKQVSVLYELQKPFQTPHDKSLRSEMLSRVPPPWLFMEMLDFSKDTSGNPGYDVQDKQLYAVTEIAQYSLSDFLRHRDTKKLPLSNDIIRSIFRAILTAMAGLHSKGFVHMDMKPENVMLIGGHWKIIDVDGSANIGQEVTSADTAVAFSPAYCAPEWAYFMVSDESSIKVRPALDAWSCGIMLLEMGMLESPLMKTFVDFLKHAESRNEAGFRFMHWLSEIKVDMLPDKAKASHPDLWGFVTATLLIPEPGQRRTCAQCLSLPFIAEATAKNQKQNPNKEDEEDEDVKRHQEHRQEDVSTECPVHQGSLLQLRQHGNPEAPEDWHTEYQDMWIARNHSFCFFDVQKDKRIVLIDGAALARSQIIKIKKCSVHEFAFEIKTDLDLDHDGEVDVFVVACRTKDERKTWISKLKQMSRPIAVATNVQTFQNFKLAMTDRRLAVDAKELENFEPVFKSKLWKLKARGDGKTLEHWWEREMWIAKNGSFVYWSVREERELICYTSADLSRAEISPIANEEACRPFAFQVLPHPVNGVEFTAGKFAAETEELRERWLSELAALRSKPIVRNLGASIPQIRS